MDEAKDKQGIYLGEFRRGPAFFTVFQTSANPRVYRVDCRDSGGGPNPCATFEEGIEDSPYWHGAWNHDEWCGWIVAETHKVVKNPSR
jgi:hypothetical protein